jgi:hypothetical protein
LSLRRKEPAEERFLELEQALREVVEVHAAGVVLEEATASGVSLRGLGPEPARVT